MRLGGLPPSNPILLFLLTHRPLFGFQARASDALGRAAPLRRPISNHDPILPFLLTRRPLFGFQARTSDALGRAAPLSVSNHAPTVLLPACASSLTTNPPSLLSD